MKLTKQQQYLIFGVILILALAFYLPTLGLSLTGATPLSCDKAEYKTSDPNYPNGSLFCSMALTGSGKQAEFVFSDAFAKEKFGISIEKTGTFNAVLEGSPCTYMFDNNTNYLYKYIVKQYYYTSGGAYRCGWSSPTDQQRAMAQGYLVGSTGQVKDSRGNVDWSVSCKYVFRQTAGVIYYLDPSIINDFSANLSMTIDSNTKSGILSQDNPTIRNDYFTAEYLGGLMGQQSCPAQPSTTAFVQNVLASDPLQYKDKFLADAVLQDQLTIVDVNTAMAKANSHNLLVDRYLASSASTGQYCAISTTPSTSIRTASVSCNPVGTTTIPVFNLYVAADAVRIVVPSGIPSILNASVTKVLSATRSEITVKARDDGEADSFDFSVQCARDLQPFTTRAHLNAGETNDVLINYEGAGIIGDCNVTMRSVNSPDKLDSMVVKLFIYPFCPRSAPSPAHQLVFTEKGCAYVCPNYGVDSAGESTDVFDASCGEIEIYDRCANYNASGVCTSRNSYSGIHCTGVGKYLSMNSYLDTVNVTGNPFIPEKQAHKYFIVSVENKPVCEYLNEYGYVDGAPIGELEFDYAQGFPEASQGEGTPSTSSGGVPEIPTQAPATPISPDVYTFLFIIVAGVAVIGGYLIMAKKVNYP